MAEPMTLTERRQQAEDLWAQLGTPSSKLESWRHTNIRQPAVAPADEAQGGAQPSPAPLADVDGTIWMVDGVLDLVRSAAPAGVSFTAIEASNHAGIGAVARHDRAEDGMTARNLARFDRGLALHVDKNAKAGVVEVIWLYSSAPAELELRQLITVASGAEVTVVERHLGHGARLVNQVTEVDLSANSQLRHCWVQRHGGEATHLSKVAVRSGRDSRYLSQVVQLGAALSRSDVEVSLEGTGASCQLDGVYHGLGRQHLDNHSVIHHRADHTQSGEHYRGVLDERSTGVFRGNVLIHSGVRGCHTAQLNRNLLLSETATVHTKPQLEIDNDDVTASHGATVGQLDEDALFYLRSRGIDPVSARRLLVFAFVAEIIAEVPVASLRESLYAHLSERLGGADDWRGTDDDGGLA